MLGFLFRKEESTENLRIAHMCDFNRSLGIEVNDVTKRLFVISIKPGNKLLFSSYWLRNRPGVYPMDWHDKDSHFHPDYKNLAIQNKNGKVEAIELPRNHHGDTLHIFLSEFANPSIVNIKDDVVFIGAFSRNTHTSNRFYGRNGDEFKRQAEAYTYKYFPTSPERLEEIKKIAQEEEKKRAEEQRIKEKEQAEKLRVEAEARAERIRVESERKLEREQALARFNQAALDNEKKKAEEEAARQERDNKKREEENTRRMVAENEALRVRLEIENNARAERERIETEALERRLQLQAEALEAENRLTQEVLEKRERMERLEIEGTSNTVAQLLEVLKDTRKK